MADFTAASLDSLRACWDALGDPQDIKTLLLACGGSPLPISVIGWLIVSVYCFIAGLITKNYSQVDRLWSIAPAVHAWVAWSFTGFANLRLAIMSVLTTLWGMRLTYNFFRKGGYSAGEQDYRWPIVRSYVKSEFVWQIFNLTFISLYQQLLLFLIASPAVAAYHGAQNPFNSVDWAATILFAGFLTLESIADQQQFSFQSAKYNKKPRDPRLEKDYARGFLTHGLFKYSRHPNFFAEQSIWWSFYIFSIGALGIGKPTYATLFNWTMSGALLLSMLFVGSTAFTESITKSKYPSYAIYQKTTSCTIPWISRPWPEKAS